jgi:hypothetical protein
MSLTPTHEAIRRATSGKPLLREKPAEFWGTEHQCKDDYCHQLSIIFGVVPWGCTFNLYPCFKHIMLTLTL